MIINRRQLLDIMVAATLGSFVPDPERLLWIPGIKTIFIPPPPICEFTIDIVSKTITITDDTVNCSMIGLYRAISVQWDKWDKGGDCVCHK